MKQQCVGAQCICLFYTAAVNEDENLNEKDE